MNLNYFGARYYDPVVGYWISLDPKEQFWSGYSYAGNGANPINSIDTDGNWLWMVPPVALFLYTTYVNAPGPNDAIYSGQTPAGKMGTEMATDVINDGVNLATGYTITGDKSPRLLAALGLGIPFASGSVIKNFGEHVVTVAHHNWSKIFGAVTPTLDQVTPYIDEALSKGDWQSIKTYHGKGGKVVGEGLKLEAVVGDQTIWVEGFKNTEGVVRATNAGVK